MKKSELKTLIKEIIAESPSVEKFDHDFDELQRWSRWLDMF